MKTKFKNIRISVIKKILKRKLKNKRSSRGNLKN